MGGRISSTFAVTLAPDAAQAVAELRAQLGAPAPTGLLFFCAPAYDLQRLGALLRESFPCPIVGCTTAGQIGPGGFQRSGITAVAFTSGELVLRPFLIEPLRDCVEPARAIAREIERRIAARAAGVRSFGLLLIDGLSRAEELLTATLYEALGDVPIVGGSAGDDLKFERTHVYFDGRFRSDAAVFALLETSLPVATLKLQHFEPTDRRLVITRADGARRIVHEIDGVPAALAYARAVGVPVEALDARVFSKNPVMLRLGDDHYVRALYRVEPDGALAFFCAIEAGLVLRIGRAVDPRSVLEEGFARVRAKIGPPALVIGCDCILRRLELEQDALDGWVGAFFAEQRVLGFSTYGEQFNAVHVNQTFTGLAIGG